MLELVLTCSRLFPFSAAPNVASAVLLIIAAFASDHQEWDPCHLAVLKLLVLQVSGRRFPSFSATVYATSYPTLGLAILCTCIRSFTGLPEVQGSQEVAVRQPLPADCPICFEQIESEEVWHKVHRLADTFRMLRI